MFVEGDQVDLGLDRPQEFYQPPGILQAVVDALHEDVFKGDLAPRGQGKLAAGGHQVRQGIAAVDGHQPAAQGVIGGVQGNGQVHARIASQVRHAGNPSGRGNGDPPGGELEAEITVGDDIQGLDHVGVVGQRFPHAHEDDVGQRHAFLTRHTLLDVPHLGDDFTGRQVAYEPALGRHAETASLGATHLTGNTQGIVILLGDQHGLDVLPVSEPEEQLEGTILAGGLVFHGKSRIDESRIQLGP
ncbi:hypothetical protein DESC_870025 [Desulfosarcina cetonica]|nr:hypothetical protein DESC_870025 [Desulfosarcina cetonica]